MFNKNATPGRTRPRAPSPAPPDMIARRRSAGSLASLAAASGGAGKANANTGATAQLGGTGAQNIATRLEANPTEGDNGGGTGDNHVNQPGGQRRGLGNWTRRILCVAVPANPGHASSLPAQHDSSPPAPAAARDDPAGTSRRLHALTIPPNNGPRTLLDPPSPPATGLFHPPTGPSIIIRQGDDLGHPIVAGFFSDGMLTPERSTPVPWRDDEEQPQPHDRPKSDFLLSPEPEPRELEPDTEYDDNGSGDGRGRGRWFFKAIRPAASNRPTPAHSQSGRSSSGSGRGSLRNVLKGITGLTPRRAPIPNSHAQMTRPRRRSADQDAFDRERAPLRTQPIPIPVPNDRRNGLEVGRDVAGDLHEHRGRQRSATEPTTVGPIRSRPLGTRGGQGDAAASFQRRPFGTPFVASSAHTGSPSSSRSFVIDAAMPAVPFPDEGATWVRARAPTPNPAPAGPDVAGVATEAAANAFRTIAIDGPRMVYQLTVALPGVRHGVVFIRWSMRSLKVSVIWIRKHISPAPTPPPQPASPQPTPQVMERQAPLVVRGGGASADGASSGGGKGGGATKGDKGGKGGKGGDGGKNTGGKGSGDKGSGGKDNNKGKGSEGYGGGGKSGGDQGDGGKGNGGKGDGGKGNGGKDDSGKDNSGDDEDLSDDDEDGWTDVGTDDDWDDCDEAVDGDDGSDSEYDTASESPLLPLPRPRGRR
ncbi:hypothetical protein Q8F55_002822 [Vanrija albida]|uniref:Uncharacterized protein n=1 Tax=Vanrija albida TaxID=181172 RepID=A0ABR3QAW3_9TREE